jgi:hypothetical protein
VSSSTSLVACAIIRALSSSGRRRIAASSSFEVTEAIGSIVAQARGLVPSLAQPAESRVAWKTSTRCQTSGGSTIVASSGEATSFSGVFLPCGGSDSAAPLAS